MLVVAPGHLHMRPRIPSVNVTGLDPCEAYIRSAQERAAGHPVRFEVGDAQALPYPDAAFDRALSMLV